jgi:hypothetical protein
VAAEETKGAEVTQRNLFTTNAYQQPEAVSVPFQPQSATSRHAAEEIAGDLNALQRQVLEYLQGRGKDGSTDEEGCLALKMNPSTYRPRRIELQNAGLVRDSGLTRKTASGRAAVVWISCGLPESM